MVPNAFIINAVSNVEYCDVIQVLLLLRPMFLFNRKRNCWKA